MLIGILGVTLLASNSQERAHVERPHLEEPMRAEYAEHGRYNSRIVISSLLYDSLTLGVRKVRCGHVWAERLRLPTRIATYPIRNGSLHQRLGLTRELTESYLELVVGFPHAISILIDCWALDATGDALPKLSSRTV